MGTSNKTLANIVDSIGVVVMQIILPILFSLALLYFLWGVFKFIKGAGDEKARGESKKMIFSGLIGLAVMVSLWGLVSIITGTFGQSLLLPRINTGQNGGSINSNQFR